MSDLEQPEFETTIVYVVPISRAATPYEEYTPFQGFSWGLIEREWCLPLICKMPADTYEFFWSRKKCHAARASGLTSYAVLPLWESELSQLSAAPLPPFIVVFSDKDSVGCVRAWVESRPIRPLHVSIAGDADGVISARSLTWETLYRHCRTSVKQVQSDFPALATAAERWLEGKPRRECPRTILLPKTGHNIVRPNEIALESCGFGFRTSREIPPTADNRLYVRAAKRAAAVLIGARRAALRGGCSWSPELPDLLISTLAVKKHSAQRRILARIASVSSDARSVRRVLNALLRPRQYVALSGSESEVRTWMASADVRALIDVRSRELALYTSGIGVRASSQVAPAIRLEPDGRRIHGVVTQLANCVRAAGPNSERKIRRLMATVEQGLSAMSASYRDLIDRPHSGVKLVTDLPLEWIPVRGLPLMLRHETSRVPAVPGSFAFQQLLPSAEIRLPVEAFRRVLVVRGLKSEDPLFSLARDAIADFQAGSSSPVAVEFADVSSRDDLVAALRRFQGAVMVFDGHGVHPKDSDVGAIVAGDERIDMWGLRGQARIPPIVLAIACDTHAIDGSHATTAAGFLAAGARTVIGTLLPVDGVLAAIMAARFVFRLSDYLPAFVGPGVPRIRWSTVITQFFRMLFSTELIQLVCRADPNASRRLANDAGILANTLINAGRQDWYDELLLALSAMSTLSPAAIARLRRERLALPECLRYVQLGNPESIVIYSTPDSAQNGVNRPGFPGHSIT